MIITVNSLIIMIMVMMEDEVIKIMIILKLFDSHIHMTVIYVRFKLKTIMMC